jgi:hypothetical protein
MAQKACHACSLHYAARLNSALGLMKDSIAISDLRLIDSPEPFPIDISNEAQLLDRVQRAARRLSKETALSWHVSHPALFQDGALFTQIATGHPTSPTAILFSKFGDLITTARFSDPPYEHSPEQIYAFVQLLETDYKFRFAHPDLLNQDYAGPFSRYRVGTWFQRFFSGIYWASNKAHQGVLRWP